MKTIENVYSFDEIRVLEFEYAYYPPEFKVISNYMKFVDEGYDRSTMSEKKFKSMLLEDCVNSYRKIGELIYELLGLTEEDLEDQLNEFVEHFMNSKNLQKMDYKTELDEQDQVIRKFMSNYAKHIDVFSMGIVLLRLIHRSKNYDVDPESMKDLKELVRECIHFDVHNRYSITKLKKDMNYILKQYFKKN